jgi:dihydrodiol dehydrogenase / D-xylose 1-dehydrogenase (NADP)
MSMTMRWGIIATGWVSDKFARALKLTPEAELVAVGSRSQAGAEAFGDTHGIPRCHPSYDALVADPDVEIVYVGTPHNLHRDATVMALEAGKHVLCEKPLAVNAGQAAEMIETARQKGLFLMEAMWTRFVPAWVDIKGRLDAGELGRIVSLQANLGVQTPFDPKSRLFNPDLAGGALLDLGVYPISLASWLLGKPETVSSWAHMGPSGVDMRNAITFTYSGGRFAQINAAADVGTTGEAEIATEKVLIRAHRLFIEAKSYEVVDFDRTEVVRKPFDNGFQSEARHTMDCVRNGRTESEVMPLDESLEIMQTMDTIRDQWGFKYSFE